MITGCPNTLEKVTWSTVSARGPGPITPQLPAVHGFFLIKKWWNVRNFTTDSWLQWGLSHSTGDWGSHHGSWSHLFIFKKPLQLKHTITFSEATSHFISIWDIWHTWFILKQKRQSHSFYLKEKWINEYCVPIPTLKSNAKRTLLMVLQITLNYLQM